LTEEGFDVKILTDVSNILKDIIRYKPHVILLDVIVPGVEGTAVCKSIKSSLNTKNIPVIVISTSPQVTATIKEICADEVISKPFDLTDLVDTIRRQVAA
jgi:two-component system phosphate regulon response regulator PhoB/two-component system alkaline phosphatase synthesis response regulator PhoP